MNPPEVPSEIPDNGYVSRSAVYIPSTGVTSFNLKHSDNPLFYKVFDPSKESVVDLQNNTIKIQNHYFKTGEELVYRRSLGGTAIGISTTSPGNTIGTSFMPSSVYPIVIDPNTIKVALASSLASQNQPVDITSLGIGDGHSFEVKNQNSKCLICIDNIIQSPVSVASTIAITSINSANNITLESLENVRVGTILKLNTEYAKVSSINYENKDVTLLRSPSVLGTATIVLDASITYCSVMSGQYNIVYDQIYFTSAPFEGKKYNYTVPYTDINISSDSFNLFNSRLKTGSKITFYSQNPPEGLDPANAYYIIKNFENNFSFAETYVDAINKNKIDLTNIKTFDAPEDDLKITLIDFSDSSEFSGRAFLRSNYSGNAVFDDISEGFNGITTSFELKVSGISTVGIKSDNGIVLVNNVFQYPDYDESFYFDQIGVTTTNVVFTGTVFPNNNLGITSIKDYDVNVRGLPRGGMIVGYGITGGHNYQPLKEASLKINFLVENVNGIYILSNDNVGIAYSGSGYRNAPGYATSIFFESESGERLSGYGTATISNGHITDIDIVNICEYDSAIYGLYPKIKVSAPVPYENVSLTGSVAGIGARASFEIMDSGEISNFKITNPGYGYTSGEVLSVVGDVQNTNQSPSDLLTINVLNVAKDTFSAWNIGKLRKLDDLSLDVNGTRKTFTFKENGQILSLESSDGSDIDLSQNLLIFVNDVLQIPNKSYKFDGGTQIDFVEAPPLGSSLKLYFYEGYFGDTQYVDIAEPVKIGDKLQIHKNYSETPETQISRTVTKILASDKVRTETYDKKGLSPNSSTYRPVYVTSQNSDLIIGGDQVSKERASLKSVYDSFTLIKDTFGQFVGVNTDRIGINTSSINLQDYVISDFTDNLKVVYIGNNVIGLSTSSTCDTVATTIQVKIWRKNW